MTLSASRQNRLVVVGTGIQAGHLTKEARGWIEVADRVLYLVTDAVTERMILTLRPDAETLYHYYDDEMPRAESYKMMTERTLECLRENGTLCVAYYGHPGVFVDPSRSAIARALDMGFEAKMFPAVSALDCLFCDLMIDPAKGLGLYEASDLVLRRRDIDIYSHIVVFQVASIGEAGYKYDGWTGTHIALLRDYLLSLYPSNHPVKFYGASQFPLADPVIIEMELGEIDRDRFASLPTLYIPPVGTKPTYLPSLKAFGRQAVLDGLELKESLA